MLFRAEFTPKAFTNKIRHSDNLFLIGSCFTEQIGLKLSNHKFSIIQNPHGILFNPVSIARAVKSYINNKKYTEDELFYFNELWASWDHHSRFSGPDKESVINNINASQEEASSFIKRSQWLMITLGSAFVYERKDEVSIGAIVSNCHKVPTDKFNRRLLPAVEVKDILKDMILELKKVCPYINVVFTISPVRHLREGFVENNRSKANLITAVHELANDNDILYFPAYELVIDDLRDYRFFAEDMAHPNYAATNYVWEKFISTCVDDSALEVMEEVRAISRAVAHKPFNPRSNQHKTFLNTFLSRAEKLAERYPYLDLKEEIRFFRGE